MPDLFDPFYDEPPYLHDLFGRTLPPPTATSNEDGTVIIPREAYIAVGMYSLRPDLPEHPGYVRIPARHADEYGVPEDYIFESVDDLPDADEFRGVQIPRAVYDANSFRLGRYTSHRRRDFITVPAWEARERGVDPSMVFELDADLPPQRNCAVCGMVMSPTTENNCCPGCSRRREACIEAVAHGGRRFGVELEFSVPTTRRAPNDPFSRSSYLTDTAIARALGSAGIVCDTPGYSHTVHEGMWKIVTDGSLNNGYELVSPPLQWGDAGQITTVCRVLEELGCEPTDDCGLHVHHDVGDLTCESAARLARNWNACQRQTNMLVDRDRLNSQWCGAPSNRTIERQCSFDGTNLHDFMCIDGGRYRPLNWTCWHSYGTVEIRMHESTFDADEILAWIAYGQGIVDASMRGVDIAPVDTIDDTLQQLTIQRAASPQKTRALLRQKAARNAANATVRVHESNGYDDDDYDDEPYDDGW